MEDVKQILVVDDHFQMLEFLRSVLEFSHHEYQVLAVPSAEEGLFELRRTNFDLVITDVRLPGMSGFDLVRKLKEVDSELPVIIITGYSSDQGMKEAEELGVKRYFKKPLDPDELLATVHSLLYGSVSPREKRAVKPVMVDDLGDVRRRLETLRSDTGARYVVLAGVDGRIVYDGGAGKALDLPALVSAVSESMQASFRLADQLDSAEPFTIQYQAGKRYDLYLANVGLEYFLAIFIDAQERRGRLGTIWVFAQRAIHDLKSGLVERKPASPSQKPDNQEETAAAPEVETEEDGVEEAKLEGEQEMEQLVLAEIQKFLGIEDPPDIDSIDLDSYWEDATKKSGRLSAGGSGMSLEEARKEGLIPADFDQQGRLSDGD